MPRMAADYAVEVVSAIRLRKSRNVNLRAAVGAFCHAHTLSNTDWLFNDTEENSLLTLDSLQQVPNRKRHLTCPKQQQSRSASEDNLNVIVQVYARGHLDHL